MSKETASYDIKTLREDAHYAQRIWLLMQLCSGARVRLAGLFILDRCILIDL